MEREKIGCPYLNGEAKKILNINTRRINFHLKSKVQLGSHHPSEHTKIDLILFLLLLWDLVQSKDCNTFILYREIQGLRHPVGNIAQTKAYPT